MGRNVFRIVIFISIESNFKLSSLQRCILGSAYSGQEIQKVGTWNGFGIALVIGIIAIVRSIIRGIFIYFIKYEAPGKRPINSMMLSDQVNQFCNYSFDIHV